jgi:hypothetical protein
MGLIVLFFHAFWCKKRCFKRIFRAKNAFFEAKMMFFEVFLALKTGILGCFSAKKQAESV